MACIRKRRHKWVVDGRDENGERHWITCETRQESKDELRKLLNGGKMLADQKATVHERAEEWLATYAKARLKNSTYAEYERAFTKYIYPKFGETRFSRLSRKSVIGYIGEVRDQGLSRSSIKGIIAPLCAMYYDSIVENNLPVTNPAVKLGSTCRQIRTANTPG